MRIFVTGAGGYIGGSLARYLLVQGHQVRGLLRDPDRADALAATGTTPVLGDLDDVDLLSGEARSADAVINAASSDHRPAIETLLAALSGSGKPLLHTSGTSVIGDDAAGQFLSPHIYDDTVAFAAGPHPVRQARHAIDTLVVRAVDDGVRSAVLCNSLIYGTGTGLRTQTVLIPPLVDQARASGTVRVVGAGLNRWSTVHIKDLATLYSQVLNTPTAGGLYFVENGEASFADIGAAIARRLGLGPVQPWSLQEAAATWGEGFARYALGANSRVRATRARQLGWTPTSTSVTGWIEHDMPVT